MMMFRLIPKLNSVIKYNFKIIKRCLLTDTYPCTFLWGDKLNGIGCKLTANDLAIQLQASLNSNIAISALDFDILMNKTNEMDLRNFNYIIKIIKDFRRTQESIKVFESSSHGLIRNLIDIDDPLQALDLIRNREKSGIFLDEISVNLLINKFIISENWEGAFFTAAEWILQECIADSRLSIAMSLVSCLHFWKESLWQWKPPVIDVSKLPVEYKFVQYLKPDYFDDHFDLCNDNHRRRLLGKCLVELATHFRLLSDTQRHLSDCKYYEKNIGLLGLALHEKLEQLIEFMANWVDTEDGAKLNEGLIGSVEMLISTAEKTVDTSPVSYHTYSEQQVIDIMGQFQNLVNRFRSKGITEDRDLVDSALTTLGNLITGLCDNEVESVRAKYEQFNSQRVDAYHQARQRLEKKQLLESSKQKLLELTEQEEMIRYFEKMPEIMYKSWLAKRTRTEKRFSQAKSNQENLDNLKKAQKSKFIVQQVE